jgi:hypothetical protein
VWFPRYYFCLRDPFVVKCTVRHFPLAKVCSINFLYLIMIKVFMGFMKENDIYWELHGIVNNLLKWG